VRATGGDTVAWIRAIMNGEAESGFSWGIEGLDRHTRLRDAELVVIGAPPSMGKTALMVNAMVTIARQGIPVIAFSAETGQRSLEIRLLSHLAKLDSKALRGERRQPYSNRVVPLTAAELEAVEAARVELEALPIYVQYTSVSATAVLDGVEGVLLRERIPLDSRYVMFFDYLQFGGKEVDDDGDYERLERLIREFKAVAQITNRPMIVFSQLKRREWKTRDGELLEPTISDFKGTGRIEADADLAMIIWGDRQDTADQGVVVPRRLTVVKQREADANMTIELLLDQSTCHYFLPGSSQAPPPPETPDVFGDGPHPLFGGPLDE
jgi:replicative DNA helicase